jgi:hypothetical protein
MRWVLKWTLIIAGAVILIDIVSGNNEDKPKPELDLSKPVYTTDRAIVCPLGLLFDVRADHGPDEIVNMFLLDREGKAKEMGCEILRGGLKVEAVSMKQSLGDSFRSSEWNLVHD